ncbi:outer membrane protein-like [Acetobacter orientalis]|uniref:Outer membrane protein-like n=1 Tax=Acetobacter orientalis TaxID=146474 RepID=A0A2Z5ZFI1_9PROT|nr:outer membrane protein-like [Acetobacter orientalis]
MSLVGENKAACLLHTTQVYSKEGKHMCFIRTPIVMPGHCGTSATAGRRT